MILRCMLYKSTAPRLRTALSGCFSTNPRAARLNAVLSPASSNLSYVVLILLLTLQSGYISYFWSLFGPPLHGLVVFVLFETTNCVY